MMRCSILLPCLLLLLAAGSSATTYIVDPYGTGDFPNIQAAVDAAIDGDVIELTDGTFTGDGNRDVDYWGKQICVRSQSGNPESCEILCEGTPEEPHRGFAFQRGETNEAVLEGVTIRGGYGPFSEDWFIGGAIYCVAYSSPTIRRCVFRENAAERGGAVACRSEAAPMISDCVFSNNRAESGPGGGLYCAACDPYLSDCVFANNFAYVDGGGLYGWRASPTVESCVFSDNRADNDGGGAAFWTDSSPSLTGCTFSGNWPGGGILGYYYCTLTLQGCTIADNRQNPGSSCGGICLTFSSYALIDNCIVAFNGPGAGVFCDPDCGAILTCCDVFGNVGGDWVGCIADQYGVNGNICEDPLFCNLEDGDFHLLEDSPCAPFSSPNPECDLIGAWPVGCGSGVPELPRGDRRPQLRLLAPSLLSAPTWIRYEIRGTEGAVHVVCRVLDPAGRAVRTLAEGLHTAGAYEARWNGLDDRGRSLSSGVYFFRLEAAGESISRRTLMLK